MSDYEFLSSYKTDTSLEECTSAISTALGSFIRSKSSTFACGGSIPIEIGKDVTDQGASTKLTSLPVTLRWDSAHTQSGIAKLQFPLDTTEATHESLQRLLRDCQPATFGYKGEDVLDDTYRKATKMDRSIFSVDFCPYEFGIIDTVAQLLLPSIEIKSGMNGVRAELYKLNIYAASGFFNAHVDTPRSTQQFGSLVISLPCFHKGGELVVFDWGASTKNLAKSAVEWAAFYSDCEHEVREVTDGHRVTLTYNLYYTYGMGHLAGKSFAMDGKSLPLFEQAGMALANDHFMPDGGTLGVYCGHRYAHTHKDGAKTLPAVLKGADMAVYSVFKALGLKVDVVAILDLAKDYMDFYDTDDTDDVAKHAWVGPLGGRAASDLGGYDEDFQFWGDRVKITWANEPKHRSADMVQLTYGNEPGINMLYSFAALVIDIPPAGAHRVDRTKIKPTHIE